MTNALRNKYSGRSKAIRFIYLNFLLLVLNLPSCSAFNPIIPASPADGTFVIDAVLSPLYKNLGGADVLGPGISALFQLDGKLCQYTSNALMCYDQSAPDGQRLKLAPLGLYLGIAGPEQSQNPANPAGQDPQIAVYPAFILEKSIALNPDATGRVLTGAVYNYSEKLVEQYFENIAVFTRFEDPPGKYGLLPYGVMHCGNKCSYKPELAITIQPYQLRFDNAFISGIEKIGADSQTFGLPMSIPYPAKDGNLEQVYENVVIYTSPANPDEIKFRPLPTLTGMTSLKAGKKVFGEEHNVIFYEVKTGLGYHVPFVFDAYIQQHGGKMVSGNPIADPLFYEGKIPRQCFRNYCLENNPLAAMGFKVQPVPLGIKYLESIDPANKLSTAELVQGVTLEVLKHDAQITNYQSQLIRILVKNKTDNSPLAGIYPMISVTLPGVYERFYSMPVTTLDGRSEISIPAFDGLASGTMIPYQVCIFSQQGGQLCERGAFLVWNNE